MTESEVLQISQENRSPTGEEEERGEIKTDTRKVGMLSRVPNSAATSPGLLLYQICFNIPPRRRIFSVSFLPVGRLVKSGLHTVKVPQPPVPGLSV